MSLETKAGTATVEIKQAMHEFLGAFEEFKSANDSRLASLEKKNSSDVLTEEKVDRLNTVLDQQKSAINNLLLAQKRPMRGAESKISMDNPEQKAAFEQYVRAGDASGYQSLEAKSLLAGSDPEGGYLVPQETEALINSTLSHVSPIREIASVQQIGTNTYRKPISVTGTAAGWVGETDARPEIGSPTLSAVDFPTMELYAMPATTQTLLDDSIVNIEQWVADEVQIEFAAQESAAFVNGDGVSKPKGFLSYPIVDNGLRNFGEMGTVYTGVDGDFSATNPADTLIDLIYAPKQAYRAKARFLMNRSVIGNLRKFKDAEGNYLWQPATQAGTPSTF